MFLGKSVDPVLLGNLEARLMLAGARFQSFQFGESGTSLGSIGRAVFDDQLFYQIWAFQHYATSRGLGGNTPEIVQKLRFGHDLVDAGAIVNAFAGELDDRAWLDRARGTNVMADSRCHRTKGTATIIPVGFNDSDRHLLSHLDNESPKSHDLFRREGEFRRWFRADHTIGVEPRIMDPHVNQSLEPLFADQIDVGFAHTGGNANDQSIVDAILYTGERLVEHVLGTATFIADDVGPLDTDQRCGVTHASQSFGYLVGDQLAIGKDLEVAIGMLPEHFKQIWMHERFTTENPEVAVPMLLGIQDQSVEILLADHLSRRCHIDPATLASQLATVDDGDEQEGRKVDPLFESFLVFLHRSHSLVPKVVGELPKKSLVNFVEHAICELSDHETILGVSGLREPDRDYVMGF